jgi:hypothetical protein
MYSIVGELFDDRVEEGMFRRNKLETTTEESKDERKKKR